MIWVLKELMVTLATWFWSKTVRFWLQVKKQEIFSCFARIIRKSCLYHAENRVAWNISSQVDHCWTPRTPILMKILYVVYKSERIIFVLVNFGLRRFGIGEKYILSFYLCKWNNTVFIPLPSIFFFSKVGSKISLWHFPQVWFYVALIGLCCIPFSIISLVCLIIDYNEKLSQLAT